MPDVSPDPPTPAPAPAAAPAFEDFGAGTAVTLHGKEPVRAPTFYWGGRPVYRCTKGCNYERMENLQAVLDHEVQAHPAPVPVVRESQILGPQGQTILVEETSAERPAPTARAEE